MVFHNVDLFHNSDLADVDQTLLFQYFDVADNSPSQKLPKLLKIKPFLVIIGLNYR